MIIRQLNQTRYQELCQDLFLHARRDPMEVSYTAALNISGREYMVKLQPERHCKMAILQAARIEQEAGETKITLITEGNLLASFLEILIYQGTAV